MRQPLYSLFKSAVLSALFLITTLNFGSTSIAIIGLINGPSSICVGNTAVYSTPYTSGYTYNWSATGGLGTSSVNLTVPASEYSVNWGSSTTSPKSVHLAVYNGTTLIDSATIVVNNVATPSPLILSDFNSDCIHLADTTKRNPPKDKPRENDCETVCEGLTVNYTTAYASGNSYYWQVIGQYQSIANETTNTAAITWDAPGQAYVVVTETTPEGCKWSDTICINIIATPKSLFEVSVGSSIFNSSPLGAASVETISTCLNSELCFTEQATGEVSYLWDFGDGNFSTDANPCHLFANAGLHEVKLIVYNECSCSDTTTIRVNVQDQKGPSIVCKNVICEKTSFSYSANVPTPVCAGGVYTWTVSGNGTITGQTGSVVSSTPQSVSGANITDIDVHWGAGPTGSISLSITNCPNICDEVVSVEVPIIPSSILIEGDSIRCFGEDGHFTIPCFPGTSYKWSINGIPQNNNQHDLWASFNSPGTYTIQVDYDNPYLGCSGSSQPFTVHVLQKSELSGSKLVCEGQSTVFTAYNGATYLWEILDVNGTVLHSNTGAETYAIPTTLSAGSYTLIATDISSPRAYCNAPVIGFKVIEAPTAPTTYIGDTLVCNDEVYIYSSTPATNDYYLQWEVFNGGVMDVFNGNSVTVNWSNGPKSISLYNYSSQGNCPSLPLTIPITDKPAPVGVAIIGLDTVCANTNVSSPEIYSSNQQLDGYYWSISPSIAGSIITGQHTDTIGVLWNNYSGAAEISLKPIVCSDTLPSVLFDIEVVPFVPLSIAGPDTVCQVTASSWTASFATGTGSSFTWEIKNPITSNVITSGSSNTATFDFPSQSGSYVLVFSAYGPNCSVLSTESHNILVHPLPVGNLTYTGNTDCVTDGSGVDFFLSVSGAAPYSYTWYQSGTPVANNVTTYFTPPTVASIGNYAVAITDANGCTNMTNMVRVDTCIVDTCIAPMGGVSFTYNLNADCKTVDFSSSFTGSVPTGYVWEFSNIATSTSANPSFTFPASGNYMVELHAYYGGDTCSSYFTMDAVVPVISSYELNISCTGTGGYQTDLINTSDVVNGPLSSWNHNWSISQLPGGPLVTSSTNQNFNAVPSLVAGQSYLLTLNESLTYTYGSQLINGNCTLTDTLTMPDLLVADFILPTTVCENISLPFLDNSTGDISAWTWDFGDASGILNQNTSKTYSAAGNYTIKLVIEDEYGCADSIMKPLVIQPNNLSGTLNVSPTQPMCPDTATVTFANTTSPASAPYSYLWNNGSTGLSVTTNQTSNHYMKLTDLYGCETSFGPATVEVINIPSPVIIGDTLLCQREPFALTANYGNSYTYTWYANMYGSGFSIVSTSSSYANLYGLYPGTYPFYVEISQGGCSQTSDIFELTVQPNPVVPTIVSNPFPACPDTTISLSVANSSDYIFIHWSNGSTGTPTNVFSAGLYTAEGTDINGCKSKGEFSVYELPDFCGYICGCFDDCIPQGESYSFPSGVTGSYALWEWQQLIGSNWTTVSSGSGIVPDFTTTTPGTHTIRLYLKNPNGCDAYSCETNLNLVACDNKECETSFEMKQIKCKIDREGNVNYGFSLNLNFADFGPICDGGYQVNITSPFGTLTTTSTTSGLAAGNHTIEGNWNTGINYFPAGVACFDIEILNPCGKTVCTGRVCFKTPECGIKETPCSITDSTFSKVRCRTTEKGEIVYDFDLNIGFNAFGTPCESYNLAVNTSFGTVVMNNTSLTPGSHTISGTWYTGLTNYAGGQNCFEILLTNTCDKTTCLTTSCELFKGCGNQTEPCKASYDIEKVDCKIDRNGHVLYYFDLTVDFNDFGERCRDYEIVITPPSGTITTSTVTTNLTAGTHTISGYWNTNLTYYNEPATCFNVQVINKCDKSVCESKVCFKTPSCGTKPEPCKGEIKMEKIECIEGYSPTASYKFALVLDFIPFGKDCERYDITISTPSGNVVSLSSTTIVSGMNTITGIWDTGLASFNSQEVCFTVTITNACDFTSCAQPVCFKVKDCKGLASGTKDLFEMSQQLMTYPNPVLNQLNVQFPVSDKYDVSIINARGQVVRHYALSAEKETSYLFDVNNLSYGVYLIKCIGEKGTYSKTLLIGDHK